MRRDNVCTGTFRLSVDEVPALIDGEMDLLPPHEQVLAYVRHGHGERLLCAFNLSAAPGVNNVFVRRQVDSNGNWQPNWTAISGHLTRISAAMRP